MDRSRGAIGTLFKLFLISIVLVPVLIGMRAARSRGRRHGVSVLLAALVTYDVLYLLMLYYVRVRWVGWGTVAG